MSYLKIGGRSISSINLKNTILKIYFGTAKIYQTAYGLFRDNELIKSWQKLINTSEVVLSGNTITSVNSSLNGNLVCSNISCIGSSAFANCTSLQTIKADTCLNISNYAFKSCTSLSSVNFDNCSYVCSYAFSNCTSLYSVSLPNCTSLASLAFYGCTNLTTVNLPVCSSLGSVKQFYSIKTIRDVSLPKITNNVGSTFLKSLFSSRWTLLTSITLGGYWTGTIGATAVNWVTVSFSGRSTQTLSSTLLKSMFSGKYSTSIYNLTLGHTSLASNTFSPCSYSTALHYLNMPNCSVIDQMAFAKSTATSTSTLSKAAYLSKASFPMCSVIGSSAFRTCTNLHTLYIGTDLSTVCTLSNSNAFEYCTGLTSIYVPASLVSSYQVATNWSYFSSLITGV